MPQLKTKMKCSAERFWQVVTSYNDYATHLQGVKSVREVSRNGNRVIVEYQVEIVKSVKYEIIILEEPKSRLSWELHSGSVFKKNSGEWVIKENNEGGIDVQYTLDVEFTGFVPKMMINALISTQMPKALDEMRRWAEADV